MVIFTSPWWFTNDIRSGVFGNNNAGSNQMSAIIHGTFLLSGALYLILNKIPLATLATILILVDINWLNQLLCFFGKYQFIFIATFKRS
jgi:MFS superfamily sulfate permease-like transporter